MSDHEGHFYGEDRAKVDEMGCSVCGWPYAPGDPDCGHGADPS